jgi:hypothetical protein
MFMINSFNKSPDHPAHVLAEARTLRAAEFYRSVRDPLCLGNPFRNHSNACLSGEVQSQVAAETALTHRFTNDWRGPKNETAARDGACG